MNILRILADPGLVARLQRFCGVEYEKPATCDQQTQTRGESSDSDSNNEHDKPPSNGLLADDALSEGSDTRSKNHTLETRNNLEECNNNFNKVMNINETFDEFKINNSKTKCMTTKISRTNGYRLSGPPIIDLSRSKISECSSHPAGVSLLNGDGVSRNGESQTATPPSPTVRIKYRSLMYLAYFGAFLGNEEFYLTFFPFGVWNLDSSVIRKVAMLWCVVMYLGQATKDYLRWPRPQWPPVVRLETIYSQEYSMPSTHAMGGTAIPVCLAYYMVTRYQVPVPVVLIVALLWFSVTCWSRLYLGVHTLLDLLVGFVYALLISLIFLGCVEEYDLYQQTHPFAVPVVLFTALALCTVCYPSSYKDSSKGDAVQIVAALTGVGIGSWIGYHLGYFHESEMFPPYSITIPTLSACVMAFARFVTGVAVLALIYVVIRSLSIRFYSYMYGLDKPDKTFPSVMTAYKFTTYTVVGIGITFFAPLIHLYFGIHRPSSFYEVL
ncbi:unnamed protein product [Candidula unifasciata]|uniref:Phosphatidic acid phosphatase type 2/haloperoxidase domain-containing protein n=1 Tax=Candidula unifasciata TaxID=100452 RepID=A0A8S3ZU29_9EUPU|nr:unnamed protein product [Candidula unifasciata]